ncbi:MAG TPA: hypothetical protein VFB37_00845, partial [Steroidobacteraceae bacterium]|nr:hypothetical protein [Steroidobacteraceae bacterium]
SHCGPVGVQGYLLAYPVEMHEAESESRAAAARARTVLEVRAESSAQESSATPLVFVSAGARRRPS